MKETTAALLIKREANSTSGVWVPKSQIDYTRKFAPMGQGGNKIIRLHLTLTGWIVKQKPELDSFPEGHKFV